MKLEPRKIDKYFRQLMALGTGDDRRRDDLMSALPTEYQVAVRERIKSETAELYTRYVDRLAPDSPYVKWIDDLRARPGDIVEVVTTSSPMGIAHASSYIGTAFTKTFLYPWTGNAFGHCVGTKDEQTIYYRTIPQPWYVRITLVLSSFFSIMRKGQRLEHKDR